MFNLIIDAGNSSIKIYAIKDNVVVNSTTCKEINNIVDSISSICSLDSISRCIVSSVSTDYKEFTARLEKFFPILIFDNKLNIPINNKYKTPSTLGSDRLAVVVGAAKLFPQRNVLVIDSGTAITYDLINERGEYEGGNISLGLKSRFIALHNFTSKLPLLKPDKSCKTLVGTSTVEAITIGVQRGMVYEVQGFIDAFNRQYNNLIVVFTGGDSLFFENQINFCTFAEPNLLALGLNEILEYNV